MREIMLELNEARCKGCGLCVAVCPKNVLVMGTQVNSLGYQSATVVDAAGCTGCRACAIVCPDVAFTLWQVA